MLDYLPHVAYVFMLGAFLTKDVLWLRALLVAAQAMVAFYTFQVGVMNISVWNALFATINFAWMLRILRERRDVRLPTDLQRLYETHFAAMTPQEFLRWWNMGHRERVRNERLAESGQHPSNLYFLLDGQVRISRDDRTITELSMGSFVAEMSLLTARVATADADPIGEIEVIRWETTALVALSRSNPALWTKIQSVLGYDLVQKIQRVEHPATPVQIEPARA